MYGRLSDEVDDNRQRPRWTPVGARGRSFPGQICSGAGSALRTGARSADEFVEGVLVGGGVPELDDLAVAHMEDVRHVDTDAPAAPAGRGDHQATPWSSSGKSA